MESNLIKLQNPLTIIGDIHGQFYDLIGILDQFNLGRDRLLFLGDYVDRGSFSIQVLLTLLCLKINWPDKTILLRGNHECEHMTSYFNFRQQCLYKYDQQIYLSFLLLFQTMPLAATVDNTFLCLHGGIASSLDSFQKIRRVNRFEEIPTSGIFCDMLWADPTLKPSGLIGCELELANSERGCSYIFGSEVATHFLKSVNLKCIVRGHQAEEQGYRMFHWLSDKQFPQVITIFSAPNYCDFYGNRASLMKLEGNSIEIKQFGAKQHPFVLPDFIDGFQWSFPFVAEKVTEMMINLLQPMADIKVEEDMDFNFIFKAQIMQKFLDKSKQITKENISWTQYGGVWLDNLLAHDDKVQQCLLKAQDQSLGFETKRQIDSKNQKRPLYKSMDLGKGDTFD